jgi:UDPglucose 6-dehydrogenase
MEQKNTITIIGAGYVGLSTAALLSNCGYTVYLIDINQARLKKIAGGESFFYEAGINPLIKRAVDAGKLIPTTDYQQSVPHSQVVFSCVGTPDKPDGSSNLDYVFAAAEEAARHLSSSAVFVQKSTVPVGTGAKVMKRFKKAGCKASYVSNPEFLREGTAISDSIWFDRIVCGSSDESAIKKIFAVYKSLEKNRSKLAKIAGLSAPKPAEAGSYFSTTLESAELIKVTANAFLAMKISFANSIALLSDKVGADVVEVMDAVGQDKRIGRAFLNAGRGYGGGCFPKDMSGLISTMEQYNADAQMLTAAQNINAIMPTYAVKRLEVVLGSLSGKKIAVLGLAFKAGTSDVRRSPGVAIANSIAQKDAVVSAYDPAGNEEALELLDKPITIAANTAEALEDTDAVIIATEWPEFLDFDFSGYKGKLIVDAVNGVPSRELPSHIQYIGIGR